MELNGLANIYAILQMAEMDSQIDPKISASIKDQLDLLERYMLMMYDVTKQYKQASGPSLTNNSTVIPVYWHEVREEPKNFPNRKERFG